MYTDGQCRLRSMTSNTFRLLIVSKQASISSQMNRTTFPSLLTPSAAIQYLAARGYGARLVMTVNTAASLMACLIIEGG